MQPKNLILTLSLSFDCQCRLRISLETNTLFCIQVKKQLSLWIAFHYQPRISVQNNTFVQLKVGPNYWYLKYIHLNPEPMATRRTGCWLDEAEEGSRFGSCFVRTHMPISITPNTKDCPGVKSTSPSPSTSALLPLHQRQNN